jgi:uncharacterized protein
VTAAATLVDAGPIVSALSRRDVHHQWVKERMADLPAGITCEAALSEATYLLARNGERSVRVVDLVRRGALRVEPVLAGHADRVAALMNKYADVPMSLTDACLVVLAEQHPGARIFTLDQDFLVYRMHTRRRIPLLAPFG